MARHRKAFTGERLTESLNIQLTPSDRAAIDNIALELGITPTLFARQSIVESVRSAEASRAQRRGQRENDRALATRLSAVGSGLNVLAKAANENRVIRSDRAIEAIASQLVQIIGEIQPLPPGLPEPTERKQLINEVTRIGTNVQQLEKIARAGQQARSIEALYNVNKQIVTVFNLVTPA